MNLESTCAACAAPPAATETEIARIPKISLVCPMCETYAQRQSLKPVVVMSCEGACLRGEIARQAANRLCYTLAPAQTVRVCLGGAFTKDTGQRSLVRNAPRLIAVEGCFIKCATRMMQGVIEGLTPEVLIADGLYDFDRELFGIDEMDEDEIRRHAASVAAQIAARLETPSS